LSTKPSDGKTIIKYPYYDGNLPPIDIRDVGFVTVRVVKDSGLLASPTCPIELTEERTYFKGTEPTEYDQRYLTVQSNLIVSTDKDSYKVGDTINIIINIENTDLTEKTLELYINGQLVSQQTMQNNFFTYSLPAVNVGEIKIEAYLKDPLGNIVLSGDKNVSVGE